MFQSTGLPSQANNRATFRAHVRATAFDSILPDHISRVSDHRVISLHERFHKHPLNFAGHVRRAEFRDDLIE